MLKTVTLTLLPALTFQVFSVVNDFHKEFPQPVSIKEPITLTETREALKILGAPKDKLEKLTKACYSAGFATDIDPVVIACIMIKESEFKVDAKSNKGYKGLMQTRNAAMKWDYAEADVMGGACDLRSKLNATKGHLPTAMVYYKGHGGEESKKIAATQMKFYYEIKAKVNEKIKNS